MRPRFRAADRSRRLRVDVGAPVLVGVAARVLALIGWLGTRRRVHGAERFFARLGRRLARIDLDIAGVGHVHPGRQYVVVALHEGFADAVALLHLPIDARFLARDELFDWPALGRYLRATDQVLVPTRPTRSSLRQFVADVDAAVADGDSPVVFAQGSILGVEVAFAEGAVRIARRHRLPLLPVAITGSHRVWEYPYDPAVRLDQRVSVRVLAPVPAGELDRARMRRVEREMKAPTIASHGSDVRPHECDPSERGPHPAAPVGAADGPLAAAQDPGPAVG